MPKVTVHRKAHFNAAHRLYNGDWSDARNAMVFGKCANPHYHGHNYELIVAVKGEINPETGFVMDMKVLKKLVETEIEVKFDHKNLNEEVEVFKSLNPTAENIAIVCYDLINKVLPGGLELQITLFETERNSVVYPIR